MMSRLMIAFCAVGIVFSLTAVARAAAIDPADLLVYYNFNGGTADSSGNGPAATLVNGAVLSPAGSGAFGGGADQALDVAGGAAVLPVGTHFDSAFANDTMAVSFWQKRSANARSSPFWVVSPTAPNGNRGFQASVPWTDGIIYFDNSGCCDAITERVMTAIGSPMNEWAHYVFQKDAAGNKQVWEDGVLVINQVGGANPLLAFDGQAAIGGEFHVDGTLHTTFPGQIDEFAFWSVALDADQVAQLAGGASATDLTIPEADLDAVADRR